MGGRPKAILSYEGKTFIENVCENMRAAGVYDITVILGKHAQEVQDKWPGNCERVLINQTPDEGQISSLKLALAHMPQYASAALMALVDQPSISSRVYADLVDEWKKNPGGVIIPKFNAKRGHPIILDKAVWPLCQQAPADKGLHWVTHHPDVRITDVQVNDEAVVRDVDTPQDYEELIPRKTHVA